MNEPDTDVVYVFTAGEEVEEGPPGEAISVPWRKAKTEPVNEHHDKSGRVHSLVGFEAPEWSSMSLIPRPGLTVSQVEAPALRKGSEGLQQLRDLARHARVGGLRQGETSDQIGPRRTAHRPVSPLSASHLNLARQTAACWHGAARCPRARRAAPSVAAPARGAPPAPGQ